MKSILTTDKANQPYGFVQLDGNANIPQTVTVQGTASYAATAGTAVNATSASVAQTALSAITASYAVNGTQWLNVSGGIAYRAGDVTIGGTISYPGLTVKVYQPTVGYANSEGEMDAVIADSPLSDNFITPSVNATSYSTYIGTNQENYAMEIEGYITVPSDTTYWFGLDSDDASDAFIDNIKVSDLYGANGGFGNPFGSNRYPIALTAGKHAIKVRFQEFSGGDFVTLYWSLNNSTYFPVPSSWFTYETTSSAQLIAANGIDFTNNSLIQSVPSSSGDGLNASTLELKPDTSLNTDQYIVLDPTSPGHIHIRAGGTIDNSGADLFLGGENNHIKVNDYGAVEISALNSITTKSGSAEVGLKFDFGAHNYVIGDESDGPYSGAIILNNNSFYSKFNGVNYGINVNNVLAELGDYNEDTINKTRFILDNTTASIYTRYSGSDVGLKLDFTNNKYSLGDYNNTYSGSSITIDDTTKTIQATGSVDITGSLTLNGNAVARPYKVYTALLNQTGNGTSTQTNGTLVVGRRYAITTYVAGDDFSNVANVVSGDINTNGCEFIATGTTPTDYTNGSILTDTSAPVATVLENTLGGTPVWSRAATGIYFCTLPNAFPEGKTVCFATNSTNSSQLYVRMAMDGDPNIVRLYIASDTSFIDFDNQYPDFSVEIRVYP